MSTQVTSCAIGTPRNIMAYKLLSTVLTGDSMYKLVTNPELQLFSDKYGGMAWIKPALGAQRWSIHAMSYENVQGSALVGIELESTNGTTFHLNFIRGILDQTAPVTHRYTDGKEYPLNAWHGVGWWYYQGPENTDCFFVNGVKSLVPSVPNVSNPGLMKVHIIMPQGCYIGTELASVWVSLDDRLTVEAMENQIVTKTKIPTFQGAGGYTMDGFTRPLYIDIGTADLYDSAENTPMIHRVSTNPKFYDRINTDVRRT